MARTKSTRTAEPVTVTYDAADLLVAKLNELTSVAWVRDAWENKAPDNYGVVEIDGAPSSIWADNALQIQVFQLKVHLYIAGGGDAMVAEVQGKLAEACDGYSLPLHEYAFDIKKNHWQWTCHIIGPLQWSEVVTSG